MKPRLIAFAILLISGAPVFAQSGTLAIETEAAAEAVIVDRQSLHREPLTQDQRRPQVLAAQYLEHTGSAALAAEQLLAAELAGDVDAASATAAQAALREYQSLAMLARARFIADALWTRWSVDRYNHFWLDQAALMLQWEDLAGTEQALRHLRKPWSPEVGKRRYSLWGQLYLRQRKDADAVIALDKQAEIAGDGLFDHYNLGLALLNTGQRDRALSLLDEIGYTTLQTQDHRMLRDRVNLMLGWHWLRNDQGGTAREYFKRVSLDGPTSGLALLGLGWAELAADGTQQIARYKRRVLCQKPEVPPDALMRLLSDRYVPCRPGEISGVIDISHSFAFDPTLRGSERYQEALRPWQVLARRPAHDPAVQEALLAAGYAQQELKADTEAEQAYRLAIERYEAESARLTRLAQSLNQPQADLLVVLAEQTMPGEFAALRGSHGFASAATGLQQLRTLQQSLQHMRQQIDQHIKAGSLPVAQLQSLHDQLQKLRAESAAVSTAHDQVLRAWLLENLTGRRERLDLYHARARIALAQMMDRRSQP
jgi:hypothetical protein